MYLKMFLVGGHLALNKKVFGCGKIYFPKTAIIFILMYILIPNCRCKSVLSPNFCIEISAQNFHAVLREIVKKKPTLIPQKIAFSIITFLLFWFMHIQNNDIKPAPSKIYMPHPITNKNCSFIIR